MSERAMPGGPAYEFRVGDWMVAPRGNRLTGPEGDVRLEPKVMQVLACLAAEPGRTVTKDEFMEQVWTGTVVSDDVLARCISELRKVFGDNPRSPDYIETVRKSGYRLIAPVAEPVPDVVPADLAEPEPEAPSPDEVALTTPTAGDGLVASDVIAPAEGEVAEAEASGEISAESAGQIAAPVAVTPPPAPAREWPKWNDTTRRVAMATAAAVVVACIAFFVLRSGADGPLDTVPFTSFPGQEAEPAFSPDGEQVVFTWDGASGGAADIYVKQPGEETPLQLTDTPEYEWSPAWSPDGQRIAFVRATEGGTHAVVVVPAIGGGERTLVELEDREVSGLAWSPDGTTLALSAQAVAAEPFSLFLLSTETLDLRRLTEPDLVEGGDVTPSFSPDGARVAFVRGTKRGGEDLFVVPTRGGEPERLTRGEREIVGVDWMPNGKDLVFASRRREGAGLWRVAASGGTPTWIATAGEGERVQRPTVARSGGRLAFEQRSADANIWVIQQGRFLPQPLIRSTRWDANPQFAPDGQRIAFASDRSGSPEVWTVDAEGLNPIQLTSFEGPPVTMPRWSPDGRRIAFDARVNGNADIYLIDANGGAPVRLTEDEASDLAPSWSQDSTTVYFSSNRSGTWEVWRKPSSGGTATRVTYHGGYNALESPDGQILYYTKKGEPGLWRRSAGDEEETLVLGALEAFDWGNWAVADDGIYFVRRQTDGPTIRFYSFVTGRSTPVASLDDVPDQPSLAVSPDGRVLLYAHVDRNESDIVLVEDFE